jgi:hypothetical protein
MDSKSSLKDASHSAGRPPTAILRSSMNQTKRNSIADRIHTSLLDSARISASETITPRAIMRGLIRALAKNISTIEIIQADELIERETDYTRMIGYESLRVRFTKASS